MQPWRPAYRRTVCVVAINSAQATTCLNSTIATVGILAGKQFQQAARYRRSASPACTLRGLCADLQAGDPVNTTEVFLIAMILIFAVPYLLWRVGRTEYYAPLV